MRSRLRGVAANPAPAGIPISALHILYSHSKVEHLDSRPEPFMVL